MTSILVIKYENKNMKIKSIAINCTNRGCAYAVTTRSGAAGLMDSVSGGGHYPKLSVLIIKCKN